MLIAYLWVGAGEKMRILITGGSGFIGRFLVEQLARDGHEIVNLDLCVPDWPAPFSRHFSGDVRDPALVDEALRGCQAVYHLAAAHHDTGIERATYFDVNEHGTQVVLDAMARHNVRDLCFISTVAVYGDSDRVPNERSLPQPLLPYGASKLAGENRIRSWTEQAGERRAIVVRPSVVFGPHNFANMYSLIRQLQTGRYVQVGRGDNVKSMCYVENLASFLRYQFERAPAGATLFNYVDGPDMQSREIVECICRALRRPPPAFALPLPAALALIWPVDALANLLGKPLPVSGFRIRKFAEHETKFDGTRARQSGFVPTVPLTEGIKRMAEWYMREGRAVAPVWRIPPSSLVTSRAPQIVSSS
jgi:GlcNAc-P-P-Und epimerase